MNNYSFLENYKIITLCGSTKFKSAFEAMNLRFTLLGKIILQPGCYVHADNITITDEQKNHLDILHKDKILMSDCIYVINEDNYIGSSTKSEIETNSDFNLTSSVENDANVATITSFKLELKQCDVGCYLQVVNDTELVF